MNSTPEDDNSLPPFLKAATITPHDDGTFEYTSTLAKEEFDKFLEAVGTSGNLEPGRYTMRVDFDAYSKGYAVTDVALANVTPGEQVAHPAIAEIAAMLGTRENLDEITDAIAVLQAAGPTPDSIMRTLWLVTNIGGGENGVRIPRAAMDKTDWTLATMTQETEPGTGDTILTARVKHPAD